MGYILDRLIDQCLTIDIKKTKKSTWKLNFKHKWRFKITKFKAEISDLSQPLTTPWGDFAFVEDSPLPEPEVEIIDVDKDDISDDYDGMFDEEYEDDGYESDYEDDDFID